MRYLVGFICVLVLGVVPLVGCGETTGDGGTGGSAGSGGTGGTSGTGGTGGACPEPNYPPSVVSQPDAEYSLNQIGKLNLPCGAVILRQHLDGRKHPGRDKQRCNEDCDGSGFHDLTLCCRKTLTAVRTDESMRHDCRLSNQRRHNRRNLRN